MEKEFVEEYTSILSATQAALEQVIQLI